MSNGTDTPRAGSANNWEKLFEAALLENNSVRLPQRLRIAKDAIMDRIEDSFDTASITERRSLLAALSALGELQRLSKLDDLPTATSTQTFDHAA